MTWVINSDGEGEIVEAVQEDPASIMPTPAIADPVLEPLCEILGLSSPLRVHHPVPHQARKSVDEDDLVTSIDLVGQGLADCLSLVELILDLSAKSDESPALQHHCTATVEHHARSYHPRWLDEDLVITATSDGRAVRRRPLPEADDETPVVNAVMAHPFGLTSVSVVYQDAIQHCFTDQIMRNIGAYVDNFPKSNLPKADQGAPTVNMLTIRSLPEDSLYTILEESLGSDSESST